jgi:sulfoacetaldehyde acetyltransferase
MRFLLTSGEEGFIKSPNIPKYGMFCSILYTNPSASAAGDFDEQDPNRHPHRRQRRAKDDPSEAFVETMVANGVTDMFGIMGSAFMDAMDIFAPAGIRLIPVVHEQGAGHMADGYARVSGRHGVTIGQNGPGISNCVTAIAAAYWAHSPVVIITPETGTTGHWPGRLPGSQPAADVPGVHQVPGPRDNPKRMAEYTGRCFDRAMSDMGPTQLNIPRDYFYGEITCEIPKPQRLTAARWRSQPERRRRAAGHGQVPGHHLRRWRGHGRRVEECKALAERLGAPVVNSYLHNDSFPASHPLWCGPLGYQGSKAAMKLIAQADVVIALGSRMGPFGTLPQHGMDYWPKTAKIIQVEADHTNAGPGEEDLRRHLRRRQGHRACADASAWPAAPWPATPPRPSAPTIQAKRPPGKKSSTNGPTSGRLQPRHDRGEQEREDLQRRRLPAPAPGAARAGKSHARRARWSPPTSATSTRWPTATCASKKPRSFFAAMSFGNCGYALPTIIGAKVAAPHRPAIAYAGDGAWGMSLMEIHDLRAPQHPGHRRGLPQPPVGRREEEPGRLLQPPLRRRRAGKPVLRRDRPRPWAPKASWWTSSKTWARR